MLPSWSKFRWVVIPDLYGAGTTWHDQGESDFEVSEQVDHLIALMQQGAWSELSPKDWYLVGYSFGGLIAIELARRWPARRMVLLEPALMEAESWQATMDRRHQYVNATAPLRTASEPSDGVRAFLDIVSPNRSRHPRVESAVIRRLSHRPVGLACALDSVSRFAPHWDREKALGELRDVSSLIGSKTPAQAHQLHRQLAERRDDWHYHCVAGVDHALPYQKPRVVAELIDSEFKRGGA